MRTLEDEFRELLERTQVVEDMAATPGWAYLADRATVSIAAKQRQILAGSVTDINEYKAVSGWLQGAEFVLSLPRRMREEVERARERDDAA